MNITNQDDFVDLSRMPHHVLHILRHQSTAPAAVAKPAPIDPIVLARAAIARQKADLTHAMIMEAIWTGDASTLRIVFDEEHYDHERLTMYLVCATLRSPEAMREVLRQTGPVRDGRVLIMALEDMRVAPMSCITELMVSVVPHMSQEQFLNIIAMRSGSVRRFEQLQCRVLGYVRTFGDRSEFPVQICRSLSDGCDLYTGIFKPFAQRTQFSACSSCVPAMATKWDTQLEDMLHDLCDISVIVDLIYEFTEEIPRLCAEIPLELIELIDEFMGTCYPLIWKLNHQVGHRVCRL